MKNYQVYARANGENKRAVAAGYCWPSVLFGPMWFLWKQMWFSAFLVACLYSGLGLFLTSFHPSSSIEMVGYAVFLGLSMLALFFVGYVANSMLVSELKAKGYKLLPSAQAMNTNDVQGVAGANNGASRDVEHTISDQSGSTLVPPDFPEGPKSSGDDSREESVPLEFSAQGREYFGIWIVNVVLTVLTLGIYSAWAKVRRLQYFYRNTSISSASFDYHGRPMAIFKGRLVAFLMLMFYNLAGTADPKFGLAVGAVFLCILPRLLLKSLKFRLHNTSYRGLRFRFNGSLSDSYVAFLVLPLASVFTLYLMAPFWYHQLKKFQHNNSYFGKAAFSFEAPVRAFYKIFGIVALCFIGMMVLGGFGVAALSPVLKGMAGGKTDVMIGFFSGFFVLTFFVFMLAIRPYVEARLQNLVWNHTRLGQCRFVSKVSARRLAWIMLTNILGIVFTLGLYRPFAVVRTLKYRVEAMSMIVVGGLDNFVADHEQEIGATGEGAADIFDIDIAL